MARAVLIFACMSLFSLGAEQSSQRIFLKIKNSPSYNAGRDVEVGKVTMRRVFSRLPSLGGTYAKAEFWLTPQSVDVCGWPELWDAPVPQLTGDEEFLLMMQIVTEGSKKIGYEQTPVAQALFSDTWKEFSGKPIVLFGGLRDAIADRYKNDPIAFQSSLEERPSGGIAPKDRKDLNFRTFDGFTLLQPLRAAQMHLFHTSGKNGRYTNFGNAKLLFVTKAKEGPQIEYVAASNDAPIVVGMNIHVDHVCPQLIEERKYFDNGRVMK